VQVDLLGDRLEIRKADATLNGGTFTVTGNSGFTSGGLRNPTLNAPRGKVQLEYPEGLQSEVNSN
jgi:hypothetical protein